MGIAAHEFQWDGTFADIGFPASGVHLENVTVILGTSALPCPAFRLLAGQPRSPWCDAASAVVVGASQAGVLVEAVAGSIHRNGRGAADGAGVVGHALNDGDGEGFIAAVLVIGDQDGTAVVGGENAHTVRVRGMDAIRCRCLSGARDELVGKTVRQGENALRVRDQGAVACCCSGCGGCGWADEGVETA